MKKTLTKATVATLALTGSVLAGPAPEIKTEKTVNCGDFCNKLEGIGKLYENPDNPYIQEISLSARFHGQYAYVDGEDINGKKFNNDFEEIRRLRAGLKIKAFNGFEFKASANLEDDGNSIGGPRQLGYENFDQFVFSYKLRDVIGLDYLQFSYGRQKFRMGQEAHISSKKIKTVERSALSNKIYDNRYTAFSVKAKRNDSSTEIGLLSLDQSNFIGNWDAGTAVYGTTTFHALRGEVTLDFLYNFDQGTADDQVVVGYEWVGSASWEGQIGNWNLLLNAAVGDNGDNVKSEREGSFYGFVVMPSTFIIENKLEFVARYQYQGSSEEEGIRMNSRYVRRAELGGTDLDGGRGDKHHSIYTGLNYHFCGNNSKVMAGVEYETLNGMKGDVKSTTLWLAYRIYF